MKLTNWIALPILGTCLFSTVAVAQSLSDQVDTVLQLNEQQPTALIVPSATADTPSDQDFTTPSLWWQEQQQGDAISQRLIDTWKAYDSSVSDIPHVDVLVNGQIWPLLNYLEQYAFITQFGESAKAYGYQLRIFTGERLVGLHVCDFLETGSLSSDSHSNSVSLAEAACMVELDYFGQGAIRGGRRR